MVVCGFAWMCPPCVWVNNGRSWSLALTPRPALPDGRRVGVRVFSARVIGCTMIAIPFRSIVRRHNRVCLRDQEREQLVQGGEVPRPVRTLDRDQRRAHWRPSVIVPEPEQVGALHWFGHGLVPPVATE